MNKTPNPSDLCPLDAFSHGLETVSLVANLIDKIKRIDSDLARQLRRAVASVPMNTAEAWGRSGGDRTYHFRVGYASALEVATAIEIARRWGAITEAEAAPVLERAQRTLATLRPLAGWTQRVRR